MGVRSAVLAVWVFSVGAVAGASDLTLHLKGEGTFDRKTVKYQCDANGVKGAAWGDEELKRRLPRADLACDPALPSDTRLWAMLQNASGGVWGGCVYDVDAIGASLNSGR